MNVFHTVQGIRDAVRADRLAGKRIGFVPTMGNLHEGHLQLVRLAQQSCDVVVVSIFVNPLQFGLNEDWEQYPRTLESDIAKLETVGCRHLFNPTEAEMYPNGMTEQTRVVVPTMTDVHCGASRPGHFEGVTTVVAKLFNMVLPDEAVFGLKDYQQLAVIRRMSEDLCIPVDIVPAPTARDADGLALSSRNKFITGAERPVARVLIDTLRWMKARIEAGARDYQALEAEAKHRVEAAGFRHDFITVCHAQSLERAACDDRELVILGAMFASQARLIDNLTVTI